MEWSGEAIILGRRKYGEADALVDVLSHAEGRYCGFVRGGMGRRQRGILQIGNGVNVIWRARVEANLGSMTLELKEARAAQLFDQPARLAALSSAAALLLIALPEREPHPRVFDAFKGILDLLAADEIENRDWGVAMVHFEAGLLGELGFGLDLASCAATGQSDDLVYVSPRTGRAVSTEAGAPYKTRLLPLPAFMLGKAEVQNADLRNGFALTGHFLERHLLAPLGRPLPEARVRLLAYFVDE
jgi:DNA repair protein RecO (recombination protein O)